MDTTQIILNVFNDFLEEKCPNVEAVKKEEMLQALTNLLHADGECVIPDTTEWSRSFRLLKYFQYGYHKIEHMVAMSKFLSVRDIDVLGISVEQINKIHDCGVILLNVGKYGNRQFVLSYIRKDTLISIMNSIPPEMHFIINSKYVIHQNQVKNYNKSCTFSLMEANGDIVSTPADASASFGNTLVEFNHFLKKEIANKYFHVVFFLNSASQIFNMIYDIFNNATLDVVEDTPFEINNEEVYDHVMETLDHCKTVEDIVETNNFTLETIEFVVQYTVFHYSPAVQADVNDNMEELVEYMADSGMPTVEVE